MIPIRNSSSFIAPLSSVGIHRCLSTITDSFLGNQLASIVKSLKLQNFVIEECSDHPECLLILAFPSRLS